MPSLKQITKSNYFRLAILGVVNLLVAYFYIEKPFSTCSDHGSYLRAIDYVLDNPCLDCGQPPFYRLLTIPLMLSLSWLLSVFTSDISGGFLILNLIFYFAIMILFYKLVRLLFKDTKVAFFATVLLIANYYYFDYCKAFLSDLGGHFFFLLASYYAFKYYLGARSTEIDGFQDQSPMTESLPLLKGRTGGGLGSSKKYFYYAIAASAIGVFFKEFGALGMMTLGMLILLSSKTWAAKAKEIIWAALLFLILPGLYHLWFYLQFDFFYLDWYNVGVENYDSAEVYSVFEMTKVLGWLFLPGWPIFFYSLWQVKKYFTKAEYILMAALLPASLAFFAWPVFMQRTAFVLVPWLSIMTAFGLSKIKSALAVGAMLLVYILVNYNIEFLLKVINLPF